MKTCLVGEKSRNFFRKVKTQYNPPKAQFKKRGELDNNIESPCKALSQRLLLGSQPQIKQMSSDF